MSLISRAPEHSALLTLADNHLTVPPELSPGLACSCSWLTAALQHCTGAGGLLLDSCSMMVSEWRPANTLSVGKMVLMDLAIAPVWSLVEEVEALTNESTMSRVVVPSTLRLLSLSPTGEIRLRAVSDGERLEFLLS